MTVIVLTRTMIYWDEINIRKAIKKVVNKKAEVVIDSGKALWISKSEKIMEPLVIRLLDFDGNIKWKSSEVPFSIRMIYERDKNICQYWHNYKILEDGSIIEAPKHKYKCTSKDRTIDHIIPVSRGGKSTYENVVTSCRYCNEIIKKNLTPSEAGLELINKPHLPTRKKGETMYRIFLFNPELKSHREFVKIMPNYK